MLRSISVLLWLTVAFVCVMAGCDESANTLDNAKGWDASTQPDATDITPAPTDANPDALIDAQPQSAQSLVGLVILTQTGTQQFCFDVGLQTVTGAQLLECSGLSLELADFGSLGRAVCGIDGVGCTAEDCFCEHSLTWLSYEQLQGQWVQAASGIDFIELRAGQMYGFSWTSWMNPQDPTPTTLTEVCKQTPIFCPAL